MGFQYRKSFKAGPFRVTASKSGISYSAGVPGARVTKRADGRVQTTLSAPGTGARYTTTHGSTARPQGRPGAPRTAQQAYTFVGPAAPVSFKVWGGTITLHPEWIEITRKGAGSGFRGRTLIEWRDVLDVEVVKPSLLLGSGYAHILTRTDPALITPPGAPRSIRAASANPNTVILSNLPSGFRTQKALVQALTSCAWPV